MIMREYKVCVRGINIVVTQDDDGNFILPQEIKEMEKIGTQLKPAFEPIIVARKPFKGSCVDNVLKYGVGGINIDECRVPFESTPNPATNPLYRLQNGYKTTADCGEGDSRVNFGTSKNETSPLGRFPANVVLTYDETDFDEVCGGMPNTSSAIRKPSGGSILSPESGWNNNSMIDKTIRGFEDSGSAARYFYCAKASTKDRDEGLEQLEDGAIKSNTHPTVKPTDLMQYLVRLVAPNGGTVLDPFNGSGSTGKAVMYENAERDKGYRYIGIELTEEYLPISKARIEYVESKSKYKKVGFDDLL